MQPSGQQTFLSTSCSQLLDRDEEKMPFRVGRPGTSLPRHCMITNPMPVIRTLVRVFRMFEQPTQTLGGKSWILLVSIT